MIFVFANQNLQHLHSDSDLVVYVLCMPMKELEEIDIFYGPVVPLEIVMSVSNFSIGTSEVCIEYWLIIFWDQGILDE